MSFATAHFHWTLALLAGVTCLGGVAGCAAVADREPNRHPPQHHVSGQITYRAYQVRQLGTGEKTYFARCMPPACPVVTPKRLAMLAADGRDITKNSAPVPDASNETATKEEIETAIVHFDSGSARLGRRAQDTLSQFSTVASQSERIVVSGRTDSTGNDIVNTQLAQARAQSVVRYLRTNHTVQPERIEIDGRGRCCYVASNEVPSGRELNRRAEIIFYPPRRGAQ